MTTSVRRITLALVLTLLAAGSLSAAWKWREVRLYRRAMAEIQDEIKNAHFGLAARHLGSLLAMKPAWDEAIYLLGVCEKERGQIDQASVTWGGVPPDSAFFRQAAQGRIELLIQAGRLADAEQLVKDMLADRRGGDSDLGLFLGPVYSQEGRLDEAMRSIEDWWKRLNERGEGASEKAINLVRLHIELEDKLPPVDAIRAFLDDSASRSPTDDRLFLGRANLAIRTGALDEAAPLLDACERRRPDDVPVWRARLRWAVASGRVAEARAALGHLPAALSTPAEVQRLAAWFARQRGDIEAEQRALASLRTDAPADVSALDRLIALAEQKCQTNQAAALRREKGTVLERQARFQKLRQRNQPSRDAAELAVLTGQLGRWFEARVYLTIAAARKSRRVDVRGVAADLKRHDEAIDRLGRTLAEVIDVK